MQASRRDGAFDDRDVMEGPVERADIVIVAVIGSAVEMSVRARVMWLGEPASMNELAGGPIANVRDRRFVV